MFQEIKYVILLWLLAESVELLEKAFYCSGKRGFCKINEALIQNTTY